MTEIYQDISRADSIPELKAVIVKHFGEFGMIRGRHGVWTVAEMLSFIDDFPHSLPTREYGIRQQLIYILYTTEKLQTKEAMTQTTNLTPLEEAAKADSAKQYPLIGKPKSEYGDQVNQEQGIAQRVYARGFKAGAAWQAAQELHWPKYPDSKPANFQKVIVAYGGEQDFAIDCAIFEAEKGFHLMGMDWWGNDQDMCLDLKSELFWKELPSRYSVIKEAVHDKELRNALKELVDQIDLDVRNEMIVDHSPRVEAWLKAKAILGEPIKQSGGKP